VCVCVSRGCATVRGVFILRGFEPPSSGYDRPPEVANADVGGVGEWELAGA